METKVTSEPKSNGAMNGGARIVVDDDDDALRYGALALTHCRHDLNNSQMAQGFMSAPSFFCPFSLPTSPTDLSELLAEGTKESHDRAENCQFVKDFLRGRIKKELFKVVTQSVLHFCR